MLLRPAAGAWHETLRDRPWFTLIGELNKMGSRIAAVDCRALPSGQNSKTMKSFALQK